MWMLCNLRKQPPLVFPLNDIWVMTVEISYWWRVTTQIWVVLLIGWSKFPWWHEHSETLPRSVKWHNSSVESLCTVVFQMSFHGQMLGNVSCFHRLNVMLHLAVNSTGSRFITALVKHTVKPCLIICMDTVGDIESVRINEVSVLSRLNLEKM